MSGWRLSRYARVVRDESAALLLHNTFMGAVTRIPPDRCPALEPLLDSEPHEQPHDDPSWTELRANGFFVPAGLDERQTVTAILDREREHGFGLIVLPHENCNLRCVYCYEKFERGRMTRPVVEGLKAFVDARARESGRIAVSWFGGEPLLASDLIFELSDSFRASCGAHGAQYASSITTNEYPLSPAIVEGLLARRVLHYQVTVDGAEATHDLARKRVDGGGTYRKIMANLVAMASRAEEFDVRIRVNFDERNATHVEPFLDELSDRFRGDPRFGVAFHAVGQWGGPNDQVLNVCAAEAAESIRLRLLERSLRRGFPDRVIRDTLSSHGTVCYAARDNSMVVGSDGRVYKCTVAFDDPRNHVGTLRADGELVVDRARWDLWTKLDGKDTTKCRACAFNPSCQSRSCPLVAIRAGEPPCPLTRTEYVSLVKLVAATPAAGLPSHPTQGAEA